WRAGSPEMVEGKAEPAVDVGLDCVLRVAESADILSGANGAELGRRAVLVGGADEEHVVADLPPEAGMDIGREERAYEIAEMLDAVHVGKGAGDENFGHDYGLSRLVMPTDEKSKALPHDRKGLGSAHASRAWTRAYPVRSTSLRSGRGIRVRCCALAKVTANSPCAAAIPFWLGQRHIGVVRGRTAREDPWPPKTTTARARRSAMKSDRISHSCPWRS